MCNYVLSLKDGNISLISTAKSTTEYYVAFVDQYQIWLSTHSFLLFLSVAQL